MYLKFKEKIIDSILITLIMSVSYLIGIVIWNSIGISYEKVYAPTFPTQADPFYSDWTA